jgi:ammonium transporter, Amt family
MNSSNLTNSTDTSAPNS